MAPTDPPRIYDPRPATLHLVLIGVIILCGACNQPGQSVNDHDYDPRLARQTLEQSLDAWKAGNLRSLSKLPQSTRFSDEDHAAGLSLVAYRLEPPEQEFRAH